MDNNVLAHYGIIGMKWGVRRYQNADGSLTDAGRKRQAQFRAAGEVAKRKAESAKLNAEDFRSATNKFKERYSGDNGWKKYLDDMYGDDWHDAEYMKKLEGIDDVEAYAREALAADIKDTERYNEWNAELFAAEAEKWLATSEKLLNTPLSELTDKDFEEAKRFAKKQMKRAAP